MVLSKEKRGKKRKSCVYLLPFLPSSFSMRRYFRRCDVYFTRAYIADDDALSEMM